MPGIGEVIDKLLDATWRSQPAPGLSGEVQRVVDSVVLYHLMAPAANESASEQARAIAYDRLDLLKQALSSMASNDVAVRAHIRFAVAQIDRFQRNPKEITLPKPLEAPPGQPIGCEGIE